MMPPDIRERERERELTKQNVSRPRLVFLYLSISSRSIVKGIQFLANLFLAVHRPAERIRESVIVVYTYVGLVHPYVRSNIIVRSAEPHRQAENVYLASRVPMCRIGFVHFIHAVLPGLRKLNVTHGNGVRKAMYVNRTARFIYTWHPDAI